MNQAYQLICCDLDGTLLNEKDEVSEKNKEMIQRCRKQGMQFAIVSGRPVEGILQLIKQWQMEEMVDYVIGMNGGVVYHCKTAVAYTHLDVYKRQMDIVKQEARCFYQQFYQIDVDVEELGC